CVCVPHAPSLYTLSLHDALPISPQHCAADRGDGEPFWFVESGQGEPRVSRIAVIGAGAWGTALAMVAGRRGDHQVHLCALEKERSEEHTSELQSLTNIVCRLLLD